jgi:hypothetical protein
MLDRLGPQLDATNPDVHEPLQQILGRDVVARAEAVGHVEPDLHAGPAGHRRGRLRGGGAGEVVSQQQADGGCAGQGHSSELAPRDGHASLLLLNGSCAHFIPDGA